MGFFFGALICLFIAGVLFLPAFVVAFARLRSIPRAFVIACAFAAGAVGGAIVSGIAGSLIVGWLLGVPPQQAPYPGLVLLFALAGAIAGAVLALYALGKVSKYPPWRRY